MSKGTAASLSDLLTSESGVFLWDGGLTPKGLRASLLFEEPDETLYLLSSSSLKDAASFFHKLQGELENGMYAAGWVSYEASYLLIPRLRRLLAEKRPSLPLAWFGIYRKPTVLDTDLLNGADKGPSPHRLELDTSKEEFCRNIGKIHDYIRAGDTYQINYTVRALFDWDGPGTSLYSVLRNRQGVDYAAFVRPLPGTEILCLSPELFFAKNGQRIWSRPMKGTAPRGRNPSEDIKIARGLRKDEKNRAENVMIVDLLRNDLGRICQTGSVRVPELFTIERYETLFQMTSLVEGRLKKNATFFDIFQALFPCGSITGAPKIRSMEIISELERAPRGIYTGAIGLITPEADAVFNVAIRTVTLRNGKGEVGVGAGITIGSDADSEYEETVLKARFISENVC